LPGNNRETGVKNMAKRKLADALTDPIEKERAKEDFIKAPKKKPRRKRKPTGPKLVKTKPVTIEDTQIFNLEDLSVVLGIGVRTLREYIKSGKLKSKKIGRSYFVTGESLNEFVSSK
jgi:excisionase family DNA binding protein